MPDYISREVAIDDISSRLNLTDLEGNPINAKDIRAYVAELINHVPAADVREVKRGKWEHDEIGADICSVCQNYAFESSTHHLCGWEPNYCPNCGADMRGESDV